MRATALPSAFDTTTTTTPQLDGGHTTTEERSARGRTHLIPLTVEARALPSPFVFAKERQIIGGCCREAATVQALKMHT